MQRLEQGGLGDERLAGAGRRTDEHALLGREPGEQRFFLHRIGRVGQLGEVLLGQVIATGDRRSIVCAGSLHLAILADSC